MNKKLSQRIHVRVISRYCPICGRLSRNRNRGEPNPNPNRNRSCNRKLLPISNRNTHLSHKSPSVCDLLVIHISYQARLVERETQLKGNLQLRVSFPEGKKCRDLTGGHKHAVIHNKQYIKHMYIYEIHCLRHCGTGTAQKLLLQTGCSCTKNFIFDIYTLYKYCTEGITCEKLIWKALEAVLSP